jgi:hypothetical protein
MKCALAFWVILSIFPLFATAQSHESADAPRGSVDLGAEFSAYNPDFYCANSWPFSCGGGEPLIKGAGVFADYHLVGRLGVEGEARWLRWDNLAGHVEDTYLVGPQVRVWGNRRFTFWGKFLVGVGSITTANYPGPSTLKGTLFAYAPGASAGFKVTRRISLRLDYEVQRWPGFAIMTSDGVLHNHGIAPTGLSYGVSYRLLGR